MAETKILVTGALGQLGSELVDALRKDYGNNNVIASDIRPDNQDNFEILNVMDKSAIHEIVDKHNITQVYHLAAMLSAKGEEKPSLAWRLNMNSLIYILEIAEQKNLDRIYWPSSIAVFGPNSPKENTPQDCIMDPNTVYGISKLAGERLCAYCYEKFGVDVRSLRYPGLIGYKALPGGGTTDYAVDIYHKAKAGEKFDCFLSENTYLPMMYMEDAVRATIELMKAPKDQIKVRSSYNLASLSFSPKEQAESIKKRYPKFEIEYKPDFRQKIADSWPSSIDDSQAREDWGWEHKFDLDSMTEIMDENIVLENGQH